MTKLLSILLAAASAGFVLGAETDLGKLDPKKPEDRGALLELVKRSSNGKSNQAAKILAQSGYVEDLLEILRTTASYHTMLAIAQTRDERSLPLFEARLRRSPDNRYLVGALAYVQSPKASPILVELLKRHPDGDRPSHQDMVGCILNAMLFNRCHDAAPLLRQRFAACGTSSQANRKSNYALTLLSLGDPTGRSWLSERIRADRESKRVHSSVVSRLATLCVWARPHSDIVQIEDESIMAPLLPELVRGACSPECPFAPDCCRVLAVLTRHDFPAGDPAWEKWYEKHAERHPICTKPLDRAMKLSMDTFRWCLAEAATKDERVKWMDYFLGQPGNRYDADSDFLWKLESHPEFDNRLVPPAIAPSLDERKKLGLVLTIALTSKVREPDHQVFRRDFRGINVTVCLGSPVVDAGTKKVLLECAEQACGPLSEYERFYQSREDADPIGSSDRQ